MKELNRDELLKVLGGDAEVEVITYRSTAMDINGYCYGQPEDAQEAGAHSFHEIIGG